MKIILSGARICHIAKGDLSLSSRLRGSNAKDLDNKRRSGKSALLGLRLSVVCTQKQDAYLFIRHILTYTILPFLVAICESLTFFAALIRLIKIFIVYSFKRHTLTF